METLILNKYLKYLSKSQHKLMKLSDEIENNIRFTVSLT